MKQSGASMKGTGPCRCGGQKVSGLCLFASLALLVYHAAGCGKGPTIEFLGTGAAASASVFVDGKFVGVFNQPPARGRMLGEFRYSFGAVISLADSHTVVVVTTGGDTLRATVRPNDSGSIFVEPEKRRIDYL